MVYSNSAYKIVAGPLPSDERRTFGSSTIAVFTRQLKKRKVLRQRRDVTSRNHVEHATHWTFQMLLA